MTLLTYLRVFAYLPLPSSGHLFLKGVSSVTRPILEVLRYVPIPAVRARIRRPRQPRVCEVCFACVLDPDFLRTAGSANVSRTGRVTPIPSPVINMTLPGNPESYSDRLRKRLDSPPTTPKCHHIIHRGYIPLCSLSTNPYVITWYRHVVNLRQWKLVLDIPWCSHRRNSRVRA